MDTQAIDQQYNQLQTEFQDVAKSVQGFAEKLQSAAQGGDQNAKEWLLDLKQIALDVKDEQQQVNNLLTALHQFVANSEQELQHASDAAQQQGRTNMGPRGMLGGMGMGGGMFGGGFGGGFGRAMEMGAGMGLGSDLISSIFR